MSLQRKQANPIIFVNYWDTVIKEKEVALREDKKTRKTLNDREKVQNAFLFAGLVSVFSVSAFPLNSRCCGQLFQRFRVSAYRTNKQALQKKKSSDFCASCTRIWGFWSEWRDSNPRPLGPEPSAIPNFATPRNNSCIIQSKGSIVNSFLKELQFF